METGNPVFSQSMLLCIVNHPNQTFTRWEATHYDLRVASLLRYGCHRLTTICASLCSFKLCSLVQLVFAATSRGRLPVAAKPPLGS